MRLEAGQRHLPPADATQHAQRPVRRAGQVLPGQDVRHRGPGGGAGPLLPRVVLPRDRALPPLGLPGPLEPRGLAGEKPDHARHVLSRPVQARAGRIAPGQRADPGRAGQGVPQPQDPPGPAGARPARRVRPPAPAGRPRGAVPRRAVSRRPGGRRGRGDRVLPAVRDRAGPPDDPAAARPAGRAGDDRAPARGDGSVARPLRDPAPPALPVRFPRGVSAARGQREPGRHRLPALHDGARRVQGGLRHARVPRERRRGVLRPVQVPRRGVHRRPRADPDRHAGAPAGGRNAAAVRPEDHPEAGRPHRLDRRAAPAAGPRGQPATPGVRRGPPRRPRRHRQRAGTVLLVGRGGPHGRERRVLRHRAGLVAGGLGLSSGVPRHRAVRGQRHGVPELLAGVRPGRGDQHPGLPARPAARRRPGGLALWRGGPVPRRDVWDAHAGDEQHALLHADPARRHRGLRAPAAVRRRLHGLERLDRLGVHDLQHAAPLARREHGRGSPPVGSVLGRDPPQHADRDLPDLPGQRRRHVQSRPPLFPATGRSFC